MPAGARSPTDSAATTLLQSTVTKKEFGTHHPHIFGVFSGGAKNLDFYVKYSNFKLLA